MKFNTVLDIGANIGQFASAARALFPEALIHCFEPLPECVSHLRKRWQSDTHVQIHNVAVGDCDSEVVFHRNSFSQSSSVNTETGLMRSHKSWIVRDSSLIVPQKRLDTLVEEGLQMKSPTLMKIDVEGSASRVIDGGIELLSDIDLLVVELEYVPLWCEQVLFGDVFRSLIDRGFIYVGVLGQILHSNRGFPIQGNSTFVSRDVFENWANQVGS